MGRGIGLGAALVLLYKEAETKNEASFFGRKSSLFYPPVWTANDRRDFAN